MSEENIQQRHMQVDMLFAKLQDFCSDIGVAEDSVAYQNYLSRLLESCFWMHQSVNMLVIDNPKQETKDGNSVCEREDGSGSGVSDQGVGDEGGCDGSIEFPAGACDRGTEERQTEEVGKEGSRNEGSVVGDLEYPVVTTEDM